METADGTSLHIELTPIPARTASNIVTFDAALQVLLIAWTNCLNVMFLPLRLLFGYHSFHYTASLRPAFAPAPGASLDMAAWSRAAIIIADFLPSVASR